MSKEWTAAEIELIREYALKYIKLFDLILKGGRVPQCVKGDEPRELAFRCSAVASAAKHIFDELKEVGGVTTEKEYHEQRPKGELN
jgi:hypothetical protein